MTAIVIDMRCFQDSGTAPAVAAHARRIVGLARHVSALARGARMVGLTDAALPALGALAASWVDEVRRNAYLPDIAGDAVFFAPAPLIAPLFAARLLLRPEFFKVAIVEDFSSVDDPAWDGAAPAQRLAHATARAWLKRYDLLLPSAAASVHPEAAARAAWDVIADQVSRAELPRVAIGGRRARVAMMTPLPPMRSGVADYSAAVGKALEKRVELTLFAPEQTAAFAHLARRYDRVVSVMGNSAYHSRIFDFHARYGGAVICHDARLLHFFAEKFGVKRTAEMASRELGRTVTETELISWHEDETARKAMCLGDLPESASPFICHAKAAAALVTERTKKPAVYLPFAIYRPWAFGGLSATRKLAARERLGIGRKEKIVVTFGFVNAAKGVAETVAAMELLRGQARLVWVGEAHMALPDAETVTFLNEFTPEEKYRDYLLAADCGLQLRIGGPGNLAGALQECIAAGLPTVASEDLAESLEAPSYVRRVSDRLNAREIADALSVLLTWKIDTEYERAAYAAAHSTDVYAAGLLKALSIG
jgi:glycosyltransferase involved in cell wall biosynthesis